MFWYLLLYQSWLVIIYHQNVILIFYHFWNMDTEASKVDHSVVQTNLEITGLESFSQPAKVAGSPCHYRKKMWGYHMMFGGCLCSQTFFYLIFYLSEREQGWGQREWGDRRGRESQADPAPSMEPDAGLNPTTPRSWLQAEIKSWTLSRLSHPGSPVLPDF